MSPKKSSRGRGPGEATSLLSLRAGQFELSRKRGSESGDAAAGEAVAALQSLFEAAARVALDLEPAEEPVDLLLRGVAGAVRILHLDRRSVEWQSAPTSLAFAIIDMTGAGKVASVRGQAAEQMLAKVLATLRTALDGQVGAAQPRA